MKPKEIIDEFGFVLIYAFNLKKDIKRAEPVVDIAGMPIGSYIYLKDGDIVANDHFGHYLGRYDKENNVTRDFYGREFDVGNKLRKLFYIQ